MSKNLMSLLFLKRDVDERINQLSNGIDSFIGYKYNINNYKSKIEKQIKTLKEKEKKLFKKLNLPENINLAIEELQRRIKKISGVENLSGQKLYHKLILKLEDDFNYLQKKDNEDFRKFLIEDEIFIKAWNETKQYDTSIRAVLNNIPSILSSKTNNIRIVPVSSSKGLNISDINEVYIQNLSKIQKQRAKNYLELKRREKGSLLYPETIFTQTENKLIINNTYPPFKITKNMAKDIDFMKDSEVSIDSINTDTKNIILSMVDADIRNDLSRVIDYMLSKDRYMFFVGEDLNQIVGIIGEIQSIFILYILNGKKGLGKDIKWIGNDLVKNGKLSSIDIIFKKIGFQVKNTTKDISNDNFLKVSFTSMKLDSFLQKINLDKNFQEIIKSLIGTYKFNVPYDPTSKPYKETNNNPNYNETYNRMEDLIRDLDDVFSLFSSILMYMDIDNNVKNIKGINIYLYAGNNILTASQILEKIYKQINIKEKDFSIDISNLKNSNSNYTIVDALNKNMNWKKTSNKNLMSINNNIKLKANYNFKIF